MPGEVMSEAASGQKNAHEEVFASIISVPRGVVDLRMGEKSLKSGHPRL